jgi:hypothetical protein
LPSGETTCPLPEQNCAAAILASIESYKQIT